MNCTSCSKLLLCLFIIFFLNNFIKMAFASDFIPRGYYVIDLKNRIEWLTCPVGMRWNNNNCVDNPRKFDLKDVPNVIEQANEQLDGFWRLPNRKELESLVCHACKKIKIDLTIFPNTPPEPFWTGEKNYWQPKYNWIVNFYNGNYFGRFPSYKPNYVRLVRDRN